MIRKSLGNVFPDCKFQTSYLSSVVFMYFIIFIDHSPDILMHDRKKSDIERSLNAFDYIMMLRNVVLILYLLLLSTIVSTMNQVNTLCQPLSDVFPTSAQSTFATRGRGKHLTEKKIKSQRLSLSDPGSRYS